ncbi:bifunctional hydroxymethylpyrimidine kinase/phosphomethylpyrimidine kinase [Paracandidimonas soli]|uniref:Hydroxymethylpyrimidine/phosphomethylpyrimidine kinase n=1 Tax=Paracandidimonas soli TaxID=1917182 RepID=A0A4R3VG28_9BURK|nr:bifunctional hydroxymethylpyrimidine kinase/phosphomethylpyrimidine kinase [Paracandidimonas soli]TCV03201.1 hydroxymethylpyrimidine/phosphomethylpyrimidine kinase [Paracandidimonas soli]
MPAASPPVILAFGPFDPSGSGNLPANAITSTKLGCHTLSVLTALHVQDTAVIEEIHPLSPELIDDQARLLLEDMRVQAICVGPLYTTSAVSVLAQIAADYTDVPLVLHLGKLPDESLMEGADPDDTLAAILELLLPQTDIAIADHTLLEQWRTQGMLPGNNDPQQILLDHGASWALSTAAPLRQGQHSYLLSSQDNDTFHWPWTPPVARLSDPDGPLVAAIAANTAQGLPMPQAVKQAVASSGELTRHTFQPGMGNRLINRSA